AAVDDFVMRGAIVEAVEDSASFQRHVADRKIFAHERPDCIQIVEPHASLKLDLATKIALHQVDVPETWNSPGFDCRNDFVAHDALVLVGILRSSPTAPETADHQTRIGIRT